MCGVYCATANPVRRTRLSAPPALDSWLFPSPLLRAQQSRGHVTPDCVGRTFKAWVAQIGTIDSELLGPDGTPAPFDPALITPYALRHTYAQRHADAGVPVDVPKELMGQVAVATTMGYYRVGLKRKQQAIYSVGSLALARASHDGGPRGRRRPVRQGQQPAGRPGRDRADTKRVERAAEADGAAAAVATQAHAGAILSRRSSPPPAGAAARQALHRRRRHRGADGARRNRRPGRQGRRRSGPAHTRETKLACLFTQTSLDPDGRPVRDPGSSTYLATLAPVEQFAPLVHAEARRRRSEHIRQLVVLGDGTPWIWNLAGQRLPAATQIVDLYHAREHLHDLAKDSPPSSARTTRPG